MELVILCASFGICIIGTWIFLGTKSRLAMARSIGGVLIRPNTIEVDAGRFKIWISLDSVESGETWFHARCFISANLGCADSYRLHNRDGIFVWPWQQASPVLANNEECFQLISRAPLTNVAWLMNEKMKRRLVDAKGAFCQDYVINSLGLRGTIGSRALPGNSVQLGEYVRGLLTEIYNTSGGQIYVIPEAKYHMLRFCVIAGKVVLGILIGILSFFICNGLIQVLTRS